jgi:hypothetical protein
MNDNLQVKHVTAAEVVVKAEAVSTSASFPTANTAYEDGQATLPYLRSVRDMLSMLHIVVAMAGFAEHWQLRTYARVTAPFSR